VPTIQNGVTASGRAAGEPVAHAGWCKAQQAILDATARGPAFLGLVGPPGTGKSWMLHTILTAVEQRGQRAMLVLRGDLPFEIDAGTVVLIDEAAKMGAERLAQLSGVRHASIVLADLPEFANRFESVARPPAFVRLAPLLPEEVPGFAGAWLAFRGLAADIVEDGAIARLIACSGGVQRLLAQLLQMALFASARSGTTRIRAEDVDQAAAFRLGDAMTAVPSAPSAVADPEPPPVVQPPPMAQTDLAPVRGGETPVDGGKEPNPARSPQRLASSPLYRAWSRVLVPAIATSVFLAFMLLNPGVDRPGGITPVVRPSPAEAPPVFSAKAKPAPDPLNARTAPLPQHLTQIVMPSPGVPGRRETREGGSVSAVSGPRPAPPVRPSGPDRPRTIAGLPPAARPAGAVRRNPDQNLAATRYVALGAVARIPGLVLVARAGDTMPALYAKVYRGLRPPPYPDVIATNPMPLRPGELVVFPAPPGGWARQ
jgi:hypothetical protein